MVTVTDNLIMVTVTLNDKGMFMNSHARIIIQAGHYVVVFVVDGCPVSSQRCYSFDEAQALKVSWGVK